MTPEEAISVSPKRVQMDVSLAERRLLIDGRRLRQMEAASIALEQIHYWQEQGVFAGEAWRALTGKDWTVTAWYRVEAWMIRWLLSQEDEERWAA